MLFLSFWLFFCVVWSSCFFFCLQLGCCFCFPSLINFVIFKLLSYLFLIVFSFPSLFSIVYEPSLVVFIPLLDVFLPLLGYFLPPLILPLPSLILLLPLNIFCLSSPRRAIYSLSIGLHLFFFGRVLSLLS